MARNEESEADTSRERPDDLREEGAEEGVADRGNPTDPENPTG